MGGGKENLNGGEETVRKRKGTGQYRRGLKRRREEIENDLDQGPASLTMF